MTAHVHIEQVEASDLDDRRIRALAGLLSVASSERLDGDPPISPAQLALDERIAPPWLRHTHALAWDETGTLLASAFLELEDRADNRHLAWFEVFASPGARRRGHGSVVLATLLPVALDDGRTVAMGGAREGGPGSAFAAAIGLEVGQLEHSNRARTADMPRDVLRSWVAEASTAAPGYSLLSVDGPFPDDLLEPYSRLALVMNDAPRDDLQMEDFDYSADQLRSLQLAAEQRGTKRWTVIARHDPTGELVGLTELHIKQHDRWLAHQGDTGVVAAHRGHGLGRWLKATNALRLLDEHPEVETVQTWNASTNPHMLAINHEMGFRAAWVQELVQSPIEPLVERLLTRP
ncbi:MAG: GNAT family N-acetyltransferase [Acidimicrobiales bacterium]